MRVEIRKRLWVRREGPRSVAGGAESLDCELREANVSLYWQEELPTTTLLAQSSITGRVAFVSNLNS